MDEIKCCNNCWYCVQVGPPDGHWCIYDIGCGNAQPLPAEQICDRWGNRETMNTQLEKRCDEREKERELRNRKSTVLTKEDHFKRIWSGVQKSINSPLNEHSPIHAVVWALADHLSEALIKIDVLTQRIDNLDNRTIGSERIG